MTNPVWPSALTPAGVEWRLQKAGVQWRSPFSGSLQVGDFVGERWEVNISLRGEGRVRARSGLLESLLMHLSGGANQIDIWHWIRPMPLGTLRGSPTLKVVTVRGDSTLVLTTAAGATLLPGDLIGVGSQVFMCRTACAAVANTLTVPCVNRARGVIAEDTAVVWNRPLVPVVMPEMSAGLAYRPGMTLPAEIQLVEP